MNIIDLLDPSSSTSKQLQTLWPVTDQALFDLKNALGINSQDLFVVLEELLINADEHGGGVKLFLYGHLKNEFCFLIKDDGAGIHETIPKNQRLSDTKGKSSVSLIRLALEEGITGTGTIGRGMGLFYLAQFAKNHGATGMVASNQGAILLDGPSMTEYIPKNQLVGSVVALIVKAEEVGV